ncbi:MAG: helix-turn-helix transcriptional regulator [Lactobacillus sp.]|jgi:DNA-binding HxlR family transcriptional regulator|nr:helix-turn-helix transcriptional regulator [Lactobacillus sp.]MCH3906065.1 helix-turn-helix transcriptional regulator [Lactobacillus sp.]MCH3990361.1 helix-turn-helix transcriptional regulator [Lactobacillus sp.]MCH4068924.1 helix-turn-helix transcriptional regulator [Lactobacillus sp.]MCI1303326.1 helix-turn-helix transcriptional regulator [Lactobacillus sp.]
MPEEKQSGCIPAEDYSQCAHFVNAFKIIGKKWTGLIISTLCDQKPLRFKDLTRSLTRCSDRVLVERLHELEELKIVDRQVDAQTGIISYRLTKKGAELKPVFDQVHTWADKWAE